MSNADSHRGDDTVRYRKEEAIVANVEHSQATSQHEFTNGQTVHTDSSVSSDTVISDPQAMEAKRKH